MGRIYKDFATLTETRDDYIERIDALSRLLAGYKNRVYYAVPISFLLGSD